jgi:hypothetical protein
LLHNLNFPVVPMLKCNKKRYHPLNFIECQNNGS